MTRADRVTASGAAFGIVVLSVSGCSTPGRLPNVEAQGDTAPPLAVEPDSGLAVRFSRTFQVERIDGFTTIRFRAELQDSGRVRTVPTHDALVVLVPAGRPLPATRFPGATLVEVPVRRIALNSNSEEAFLEHLGVVDRVVAVGGPNSYNDSTRARVIRGEIKQIGYGWYRAPDLDVALAARPDLLVLRVIRPADTPSLDRANKLGLAAIPFLGDAEKDYLGRGEWIKVFGLLTGRARTADSLFEAMTRRVDSLKALAATRPPRPLIWAYSTGADRWQALVRGPIAGLLRDAGGRNLLAEPEDPRLPDEVKIGTERLLVVAQDAECWFAGDGFPTPLPKTPLVASLRPWRNRCVFFNNGRVKAEADAWDWFHRAPVRPDVVLEEMIKALYPDLVTSSFDYFVRNQDYAVR